MKKTDRDVEKTEDASEDEDKEKVDNLARALTKQLEKNQMGETPKPEAKD